MFVNKIRIVNFKHFGTVREFVFTQNAIIVGNNGVGKSSILEALDMALTGNYRGKNILKILCQDLFNNICVKEYLEAIKTDSKKELPKIEISVFFDNYPDFRGDGTPDGSEADGFTFHIEFDDKYKELYATMVSNNEIDSLPIEFYQIRWETFSRRDFFSSKNIGYKGLLIDSDNFLSNNLYTSRIIKEYFDKDESVKMSQAQRKMFDSLLDNETVASINEKILENKELKDKNVTIGVLSVSKSSWENLISTKVDDIPFDIIGKGEQCIIKTYLSFTSPNIKNKGMIMIEEPECHLSYGNLNKLLSFIKTKLCDYQVLITTHSSFVLNKLGLNKLLLLSESSSITFDDINPDSVNFFEKKAGYDTLRFLLCNKSILVEGDSDELVVQRAYRDNFAKLPIEDGIDVISVGLSFLRFLEIAKKLNLNTCIITDNDGNVESVKKKYADFRGIPNIRICYSKNKYIHSDMGISKEAVPNLNTLEPEILFSNSLETINTILETTYINNEDLLHHMVKNKTDVAWKIFQSNAKIQYPSYILQAIGSDDAK